MINHRTVWLGLVLTALALLLSGCTGNTPLKLPFSDNFDDAQSGWGVDQSEAFERGYRDGEYFIQIQSPNWFMWTSPSAEVGDIAAEADLYLAPTYANGYAGLLCRHKDRENFYYFAISPAGYYAIFRRVGGGDLQILTGGGSARYSEAIRQGERVNHVKAICRGDVLSLYVNGEMVESVTDTAHSIGDVGIGVASGPEGDTRFHFDNFEATQP
ncbi:MAG: LamG domain-containing protein [Anaerolineales bacterium]|nr:LamG domain-containing protein [Anaerolineales bacterium]